MSAVLEAIETPDTQVARVALGLAYTENERGDGRGHAYLVRLNRTVLDLLEMAKPADQSMVSFLRECALTVSLQRLEASQK